jgi:hypothetical protein
MLEKNKVYNHNGTRLVYKGMTESDLIFIINGENNTMLEVTMPTKIVQLKENEITLNGKGIVGANYIYKDRESQKFKELKQIYDNALKGN